MNDTNTIMKCLACVKTDE